MGKIIKLFPSERVEMMEIQAGAHMKCIGMVPEKSVLKNAVILPDVLADKVDEMVNYHKRYSIAEAIDKIITRVEEDEQLTGKPFTVTIYPQEISKDDFTGHDKLTTTVELGTPVEIEIKCDTTVEICNK